jgi:hypothetical protein
MIICNDVNSTIINNLDNIKYINRISKTSTEIYIALKNPDMIIILKYENYTNRAKDMCMFLDNFDIKIGWYLFNSNEISYIQLNKPEKNYIQVTLLNGEVKKIYSFEYPMEKEYSQLIEKLN